MKFKFLSLFLLSASLFIVSCGDDTDTCEVLSETVVGSWSIDELADGTVTMNTDGTLVDSDNVIFDTTFDGTTKTWDISSDTLNLNADDGTQTTVTEFVVSSFTCDQLIADNSNNTFTFKRN